jgi:hypothetical protein
MCPPQAQTAEHLFDSEIFRNVAKNNQEIWGLRSGFVEDSDLVEGDMGSGFSALFIDVSKERYVLMFNI